jgi:hypothetical protein
MPRLDEYRRLKGIGRCVRCPKPAIASKRFCALCLKIHSTERLLLKYKRQRQGLCFDCPSPACNGSPLG